MPRFKGSCGCYNRQDARDLGLATAIVWNDLLDRSEHFDENPMWYDQNDAAERLGMDRRAVNRAITKLNTIGRIEKKIGYRPGSSVTTTWVTIKEDVSILEVPKRASRKYQNEHPILKDTNNKDTNTASQPKVAPQTSRKKSEFNLLVENIYQILSLDVSKINWAMVRRWYNEGRSSNCTDEDFIKAAKAMKKACDNNGITPGPHKVFTNTAQWLKQYDENFKEAFVETGSWADLAKEENEDA